MSAALDSYLALRTELARVRWVHAGFDSPEEDAVLDRMDSAWDALTGEDRAELERRPSPPQLVKPILRGRLGQLRRVDRDVFGPGEGAPREFAEVG